MKPQAGTAGDALMLKKTVEGLMAACQQGNLQAFKKATKDERFKSNLDALKDIRDDYGRSLLHQAAQMGHVALCQHMVEKLGFDVNDQDKTGVLSLHECKCKFKPGVHVV
eukprot:1151319-Pelagomonas_calceolata.AAC.4